MSSVFDEEQLELETEAWELKQLLKDKLLRTLQDEQVQSDNQTDNSNPRASPQEVLLAFWILAQAKLADIPTKYILKTVSEMQTNFQTNLLQPDQTIKIIPALNQFIQQFKSLISDSDVYTTLQDSIELTIPKIQPVDPIVEDTITEEFYFEGQVVTVSQAELDDLWSVSEFDLTSEKPKKSKSNKSADKDMQEIEALLHENLDYDVLGDNLETEFFKLDQQSSRSRAKQLRKEYLSDDEEQSEQGEDEVEENSETLSDLESNLLEALGTAHVVSAVPRGKISQKSQDLASMLIMVTDADISDEDLNGIDVDIDLLGEELSRIQSGKTDMAHDDLDFADFDEEISRLESRKPDVDADISDSDQPSAAGVASDNVDGEEEEEEEIEYVYEEVEVTDDEADPDANPEAGSDELGPQGVKEDEEVEYEYVEVSGDDLDDIADEEDILDLAEEDDDDDALSAPTTTKSKIDLDAFDFGLDNLDISDNDEDLGSYTPDKNKKAQVSTEWDDFLADM
jgi:hypothetical protein